MPATASTASIRMSVVPEIGVLSFSVVIVPVSGAAVSAAGGGVAVAARV